jgi:LysM repeat protein
MRWIKFLIVLALALAIFGTAGFFAYKLFLQPAQLDHAEAKAVAEKKAEAAANPAATPTPLPDYSVPIFEKAIALKNAGKLLEARQALRDFLTLYPQSTKRAEAKAAIGEISMQFIYTGMPGPDKVDYTVVGGDSLVRIAGKTKSNAELILRSNNLASIDLQIGQQLRIPTLETSLVIDRAGKTLSLLNHGQLLKEYPLLAMDLPSAARGKEPATTQVKDKVALHGSERVAFGGRDYVGSERWILLGLSNAVIRGRPEPDANGQPAPMPTGVVLSQEDIEEIFPLVSRGTPVTIQ